MSPTPFVACTLCALLSLGYLVPASRGGSDIPDPSCSCTREASSDTTACGANAPTIGVTWDPASFDGLCEVDQQTNQYCWEVDDCLAFAKFTMTAAPGTFVGAPPLVACTFPGFQYVFGAGSCGVSVPRTLPVCNGAGGVICNYTLTLRCRDCVE
jgi:hypothetical protein